MRDALLPQIRTIDDLANIDPEGFIKGKKTPFAGIGPDNLRKFHERARLITSPNPEPYLTAPVALPATKTELFFDIEVDPMRDVCYLHGFVERKDTRRVVIRYLTQINAIYTFTK